MSKVTRINFEFILLVCIWVGIEAQKRKEPTIKPIETKRPFDDFIEKTSLTYHFKKITDQKSAGQTRRSYGKTIMQVIDRTDELIQFDIDKAIERDHLVNASRRYMVPSRGYIKGNPLHRDPYHLRARLYELMKQTIYEVRDKIMIITKLREQYNWHSLYKMGFLVSKIDEVAKSFNIYSQKGYILARVLRNNEHKWYVHVNPTMLNEMLERQLNSWFEYELLTDVLKINDNLARKTLNYMKKLEELDNWFTDSFDDVYHVYKVAAMDIKKRQLEKEKEIEKQRRRDEIRKKRPSG